MESKGRDVVNFTKQIPMRKTLNLKRAGGEHEPEVLGWIHTADVIVLLNK